MNPIAIREGIGVKKAFFLLGVTLIPVVVSASELDAAKSAIRNSMKDPVSTQFKSVTTINNTLGNTYVCGEVNAKNSYGGYVGFKEFAYKNGRYVVDGSYETPDDLEFFSISGCGGKELERVALARKQAKSGCNITWGQITDVVLFNKSPEKAADNAITKIKLSNPALTQQQVLGIRKEFIRSISKIVSDEKFVDSVKKETEFTQKSFVSYCVDSTSKSISGM